MQIEQRNEHVNTHFTLGMTNSESDRMNGVPHRDLSSGNTLNQARPSGRETEIKIESDFSPDAAGHEPIDRTFSTHLNRRLN